MPEILIHPRVHARHPEITNEDVVAAMKGMIRYQQREAGEWIAIGLDSRSRLVELVYRFDDTDEVFFVYHAMTPPSGKSLRELGLER